MMKSITPILNVSSIRESFAWFEGLGWRRGFAWNQGGMIACGASENVHGAASFGSVCEGEVEIFLCVGGQGSKGIVQPRFPGDDMTDGVWMSWWVEDVDAFYEVVLKAGALVTMLPTNQPWGVREFHLRHPDGHMFRVSGGIGEA